VTVAYESEEPAEQDPVAHRPGCRRPGLTRRRVVAHDRGGLVMVEVACIGCTATAVVEPGPGDTWLAGG